MILGFLVFTVWCLVFVCVFWGGFVKEGGGVCMDYGGIIGGRKGRGDNVL